MENREALLPDTLPRTTEILDAISRFHRLRRIRDASANASPDREHALAEIRQVLERLGASDGRGTYDLVRAAPNRSATIAVEGRLLRGRVVQVTLRTLDVVTAHPLGLGARVGVAVDREDDAARPLFYGRIVSRFGRRATVALLPPPGV